MPAATPAPNPSTDSQPPKTPGRGKDAPNPKSMKTPQPPKARPAKKPTKKKAKKTTKKKNRFHLTKDKIPKEMIPLKNALQRHIALIWGYDDVTTVPPKPDAQTKANFKKRYTDFDAFKKQLGKMPDQATAMRGKVAKLRESLAELRDKNNVLGQQLGKVDDNTINITSLTLAHYHIDHWCIDLDDDPMSDYNKIQRTICIDTFRQAVIAGGYIELGIDQEYMELKYLGTLGELFDNYVFSHVKHRARVEDANPGKLAQEKADHASMMRRTRLGDDRGTTAARQGWDIRIQSALSDPNNVSDDERVKDANGHWKYVRLRVKGRSDIMNKLVDVVDDMRAEEKAAIDSALQNGRFTRRVREAGPSDRYGPLRFPPAGTAVDWFDREYFNSLPANVRLLYSYLPSFIFPPPSVANHADLRKNPKAAAMSRKKFIEKYGKELMKNWELISEEDIAKMREGKSGASRADPEAEERRKFNEDVQRAFASREVPKKPKGRRRRFQEEEDEGEELGSQDDVGSNAEDSVEEDGDYAPADDEESDDEESSGKGKKKAAPKGKKREESSEEESGSEESGSEESGSEESGSEESGSEEESEQKNENKKGKRKAKTPPGDEQEDVQMGNEEEEGEKDGDKGKDEKHEGEEVDEDEEVDQDVGQGEKQNESAEKAEDGREDEGEEMDQDVGMGEGGDEGGDEVNKDADEDMSGVLDDGELGGISGPGASGASMPSGPQPVSQKKRQQVPKGQRSVPFSKEGRGKKVDKLPDEVREMIEQKKKSKREKAAMKDDRPEEPVTSLPYPLGVTASAAVPSTEPAPTSSQPVSEPTTNVPQPAMTVPQPASEPVPTSSQPVSEPAASVPQPVSQPSTTVSYLGGPSFIDAANVSGDDPLYFMNPYAHVKPATDHSPFFEGLFGDRATAPTDEPTGTTVDAPAQAQATEPLATPISPPPSAPPVPSPPVSATAPSKSSATPAKAKGRQAAAKPPAEGSGDIIGSEYEAETAPAKPAKTNKKKKKAAEVEAPKESSKAKAAIKTKTAPKKASASKRAEESKPLHNPKQGLKLKRGAGSEHVHREPASRDHSEADVSEHEVEPEDKWYMGGKQVWGRKSKEGSEGFFDKSGNLMSVTLDEQRASEVATSEYKGQTLYEYVDPDTDVRYWIDRSGQPVITDSKTPGSSKNA
ncbi:hypothetical protein PQX77_012774 [Marasmius sp. AFHP31]|nr:hypothetical protein PQX77_012774 [Marasmius sp. AFHP31]